MASKDFSSESLEKTLYKYLENISKEVNDNLNKGLEEATNYLKGKLEDNTPVDKRDKLPKGIVRGYVKASWITTMKYNNVKYINNVAVNSKGVPIVNLLEFGSKGKPFVRKTLSENETNITNIIKKNLEKEN